MTQNVSHNGMEPFENPELLPLEELKLKVTTEGVVELVPALHKKWVDDRYFLQYEIPQLYTDDGSEIMGAKERWLEIIGYINDDIKWLLELPFYRFWSNIVFNTSILDTLVSFLQEAPPFYTLENFPNIPEMLEHLETLRRNILVLFARLVTNKESSTEYMNRPFFGNLLYENYIFTVPIIFDLCQLYGRENAKIIERILKSLFTLQPLYNDDLQKAVPCLIVALEHIEQRFHNRPMYQSSELPSLNTKNVSVDITLVTLEDMVTYILDISSTLVILLKNYPPAVDAFHKEAFMNKIVIIYENTIPKMYEKLNELAYNDECMPQYIELKHRLDVSRVEILQLYRTIIYSPLQNIQKHIDSLTEDAIKQHVDDYVTLLSNAISEKEFITDYHQFYPINDDLEILLNICPEVDTMKCDYILQSVYATIGDIKTPITGNSNDSDYAIPGPSGMQNTQSISDKENTKNNAENSATIGSIELASLVTEVKDILCHLGDGFIEMCLKHYNYNSASVINAILEDTLPPNLKELDYTLPHIPPDPMEASAVVDAAIGVERLNVFDNDEFDIMTHDTIDLSKVHRGKRKDKYKDINEMLNDKSDVKKASEFYNKYSLIVDDYDDDYDDAYNGYDVRGTGQDESTEVDARAFTTPRVLLSKTKQESMSEDEVDSNEENSTGQQNGRDHFLQNPADLRAKIEQRKQIIQREKTPNNVVGKPKGQGQDKDILVNRHKKNAHKATRANHNRRTGALCKRKQGMIPS